MFRGLEDGAELLQFRDEAYPRPIKGEEGFMKGKVEA